VAAKPPTGENQEPRETHSLGGILQFCNIAACFASVSLGPTREMDNEMDTREPHTHVLKAHPLPFHDLEIGFLDFTIRHNDRDFQIGDRLVIREWNPQAREFTGAEVVRYVKFLVGRNTYDGVSDHLLQTDVVVLGLSPLRPQRCAVCNHIRVGQACVACAKTWGQV